MANSESVYTHDLPPGDIAALLERLRRVDGVRYDCTILVWEQCQALTQELDRLQRLVESLCRHAGGQAELLGRKAERRKT